MFVWREQAFGSVADPATEPKVTGSNPVGRARNPLETAGFALLGAASRSAPDPAWSPGAAQRVSDFGSVRRLRFSSSTDSLRPLLMSRLAIYYGRIRYIEPHAPGPGTLMPRPFP